MQQDSKSTIATLFGQYLDQDDFVQFKTILAPDCQYEINGKLLTDNETIAGLYEKNMKEGKLKFDELRWGEAVIKKVTDDQFDVYFSDFLTHQGITHNYHCKQRVTINAAFLVSKIEHIELPGEKEKLTAFYAKVGL